MKGYRFGLLVCASLSLFAACGVDAPDPTETTTEGIVRGKVEKKLPQVVAVRINGFNGGWTLCSGTYFSSRMVVTAAHCLRSDAIPGQTFVYYGDDYMTRTSRRCRRSPRPARSRSGRASRPRRQTPVTARA